MGIHWIDKERFLPSVAEKLRPVQVVLDIGCGIMPQNYLRPVVHICCEPYEQYVMHLRDKTRAMNDRQFVILKASWQQVVELFPPKSVDSVFLLDVIEHIDKAEAVNLLRKTERLARVQIIIQTPLGFLPQQHPDGKDAWGLDGGTWQEHKAGWYTEDFYDEWEVYVTRDFYTCTNMGCPLKDPKGALWAVKNIIPQVEAENLPENTEETTERKTEGHTP